MAKRDGSDPSPFALSNRRYLEGQGIYFAECDPKARPSILVDYADLDNPRIVRG
jgi:uridine kinase